MSAELRIFTRIIGETFKGIKRTRWMNLIIITTMAAILSMFGCLFRTSLFIANFVNELGNSMEVSIYLKQGKNPENVKEEILKYKNIKSIKIITKQQAWEGLKSQMDLPDMGNPLPDTIRVKLVDRSEIDEFIKNVKKIQAVEEVQYAKQLADHISTAGYYANIAALIIIILLSGLTFFIINNTIHLVIESKKQEIEIMLMMGVSNWYIKAPYILQGAFYGFWAGTLAIIPLLVLSYYLKKLADFFYIDYLFLNTNIVILAIILAGIAVGAIGSTISVRKYLKV
ncbi:MAG: hypothetical protein A2Y25_02610 [Candidatus Melainabacteria bacterium GWF2_37_15]|nr:MAG: hypothetical protein A2Y25_02610 [Candidatus Melainabacteria bacterium GWF2_37_15]